MTIFSELDDLTKNEIEKIKMIFIDKDHFNEI